MLEKDVVYSKISIIKNCLKSIEHATGLKPEKLDEIMIQDVFVLNVQRAVQACIDLANIVISMKGFKLPASYKQSFQILEENKIIEPSMADEMMKMVGFRNIAVHDYQELDVDILKSILKKHLPGFEKFYTKIYEFVQGEAEG